MIGNRSRLLIRIIQEVRRAVGPKFPISVKLNSSDFQKGGFTEEESLEVIKKLDHEGTDLLEISGGTYKKLAFFLLNDDRKESTKRREAYFIDFAKKIRAVSNMPLLITGGFRSFDFCNKALASQELNFIGMARPFLTNLTNINLFIQGKVPKLENFILRTGIKAFEDSAEGGFYARQIIRMSKGKPFKPNMTPLWCSSF
ncbi:MAG: 2,4-dienoyl-CoA reductase-like NADH-dependent reductase (Old Yellow Enzyme family) [Arcticibacterium sp.]|jgi:2,4-dienoyl-CoA reductase-like NADH-dependent reductase (Old Yellow Enzyme family)